MNDLFGALGRFSYAGLRIVQTDHLPPGPVIGCQLRFVPVHPYWAAWERVKARLFPWWLQGPPGCFIGAGPLREPPSIYVVGDTIYAPPQHYQRLMAELGGAPRARGGRT